MVALRAAKDWRTSSSGDLFPLFANDRGVSPEFLHFSGQMDKMRLKLTLPHLKAASGVVSIYIASGLLEEGIEVLKTLRV
jgi:hypothetical protein